MKIISPTQPGHGAGVTLHEGTEKVQAGKGLVKALRHHTFAAARPLTDDDAVFSEMGRDLVSLAATGACATLFMLGMTGSGWRALTSQARLPLQHPYAKVTNDTNAVVQS